MSGRVIKKGGRKRGKKRYPPFTTDGRGAHCKWCERPLLASTAPSETAATRDHVIPKAYGGTFRVWACVACNFIKGDLLPDVWALFMAGHPKWWRFYKQGLNAAGILRQEANRPISPPIEPPAQAPSMSAHSPRPLEETATAGASPSP